MKTSTHSLNFGIIRKNLGTLLLLALSIVLPYQTCTAQSDEEMKLLQMFFKDKEIFSSATRHPKPVSQIAENVSVVTDKEIEAMNAHTVAEVLNRVNGIFMDFSQGVGKPGSSSLLHIQGSEERHVLVVVDGVPWNSLSGGAAETNSIPVGIVERIEIIKGPGSSSWGSSLGGVVHIITKGPGYTTKPKGTVQGSYGESSTQDYRAELSGSAGKLGYYIFGGRQDSEGFGPATGFDSNSFYSKLSYPVSTGVDLGLTLGYSQPDMGLGIFSQSDVKSSGHNRNFWGTASLDASFKEELSLSLRLFRLQQKSIITNEGLGLGFVGTEGELFQETAYDEKTTGGTASLVWKKGLHTAVLGAEFNDGNLDQTIDSGRWLQWAGAPAAFRTEPEVERGAVYLNDTIVIGRFSITPGIRYDYNSITESFISPSLGLTYKLGNETILRGSVARGFTAPPLSWVSGGALFLDPNPSLKNERVWSYQIGAETAALRYCWLKGTLFRHEVDNIFQREFFVGAPPSYNDLIVNSMESVRQGIEVEAESLPFWNLTLRAGFTYVNLQPVNSIGSSDIYTCNMAVAYKNDRILNAELFGHYIWWDAEAYPNARYGDFIWDLNLNRKLYAGENASTEIFLTAHNLFNGSQYLAEDLTNPDRWVEAGIRIKF